MSLLFPFLRPMLSQLVHEPFARQGWSFELKWDGIRALIYMAGDHMAIYSRNGHIITQAYPELVSLMNARCSHRDSLLVLDGEIVSLDERGVPNFQQLQSRISIKDRHHIREFARTKPVSFVAFDLLVLGGELMIDRPLHERRALLHDVVEEGPALVISRDFGADGEWLFRMAKEREFEGIVGKRLDSLYRPGRRSFDWLKVKVRHRQDCAVLGWTEGDNWRGFGALVMGIFDEGTWRYVGKVGSGFSAETIERFMPLFERLASPLPPLREAPADLGRVHWLQPQLVCEVEFSEWTLDGSMRAPVLIGLRSDKDPTDCVLEFPLQLKQNEV